MVPSAAEGGLVRDALELGLLTGRTLKQGDGRHRRHRRTVVMSLCRYVVMRRHVSLCRRTSSAPCRYVVTCRHVSSCVVMCRYVVMSLCRHRACVGAASVGAPLRGVMVILHCTEGLYPVVCPHDAGLLRHLL